MYVEWCEVERQLTGNVGIDMQLNSVPEVHVEGSA